MLNSSVLKIRCYVTLVSFHLFAVLLIFAVSYNPKECDL
uniref:Uncharacterized protein n=1 Tax=Anguilla anguilla TaxID=7936 RepID=A0A0E9R5R1_ANGAN